jgi:hypothetical protein
MRYNGNVRKPGWKDRILRDDCREVLQTLTDKYAHLSSPHRRPTSDSIATATTTVCLKTSISRDSYRYGVNSTVSSWMAGASPHKHQRLQANPLRYGGAVARLGFMMRTEFILVQTNHASPDGVGFLDA